jgi:hypothetical protein
MVSLLFSSSPAGESHDLVGPINNLFGQGAFHFSSQL